MAAADESASANAVWTLDDAQMHSDLFDAEPQGVADAVICGLCGTTPQAPAINHECSQKRVCKEGTVLPSK